MGTPFQRTALNRFDAISDSTDTIAPEVEFQALLPYLPSLLVQEVLNAPSVPPVRHTSYQGSVLFADIAGFSQMSEALSTHGKVGAEEMTNTLNRHFTDLLDIASLYGGQQVKFGGDALLLYFGGQSHTERAAGCALRIQRALQDFSTVRTSSGDYPLTVKIGASSGSFYAASVGRPGGRHEYVFSGPGVTRAIAAEELAAPGEVFVGPHTADLLASQAELFFPRRGYGLLKRLERPQTESEMSSLIQMEGRNLRL